MDSGGEGSVTVLPDQSVNFMRYEQLTPGSCDQVIESTLSGNKATNR